MTTLWTALAQLGTVLMFCNSPATETLVVLNAYEQPEGVYRIILRNEGTHPIELSEPEILLEHPAPILWALAEPEALQPGEEGCLSYRLDGRTDSSPHRIRFREAEAAATFGKEPAVLPQYLVHDDESTKIYLYAKNNVRTDCHIARWSVNGNIVDSASEAFLPAGRTTVLIGTLKLLPQPTYGVPPVILRLWSPELGEQCLYSRLYEVKQAVSMKQGRLPEILRCVHRFASKQAAGRALVECARNNASSVRIISFCNEDLSAEAPVEYGAVVEFSRIEPQTTYQSDYYAHRYIDAVYRGAYLTKTRCCPNAFFADIFKEDIHKEGTPVWSLSAIRNTIYSCFAAGSKGVHLYPSVSGTRYSATFENGFLNLVDETELLLPLVAISEPVEGVTANAEAWCAPHLLLCGDKGYLLILLPRQDPDAAAASREATINIALPDRAPQPVPEAAEIGGERDCVFFRREQASLVAQIRSSPNVRVFFLKCQ